MTTQLLSDILATFSPSGISGYSGNSGISGWSGANGTSGVSGLNGAAASSGYSGTNGVSGVSGINGASGTSGWSGTSGISGYSGAGTDGVSGYSGTNGVSGYSGASLGYLEIPQDSQSADYTLVLADSGKHVYHPSADTTARTWTIPANGSVAYPIGSSITFINDTLAGTITIAITTDQMLLIGTTLTGSRTLLASGVATIIKVASTRWIISGSNIS